MACVIRNAWTALIALSLVLMRARLSCGAEEDFSLQNCIEAHPQGDADDTLVWNLLCHWPDARSILIDYKGLNSSEFSWQDVTEDLLPADVEIISTSNGNVINITIIGLHDFEGSLPDELCGLNNLQHLAIRNSMLKGSLPGKWSYGFKDLPSLDLSYNTLTGNLPASWFMESTMSKLDIINLESNQLSGRVSDYRYLHLLQNGPDQYLNIAKNPNLCVDDWFYHLFAYHHGANNSNIEETSALGIIACPVEVKKPDGQYMEPGKVASECSAKIDDFTSRSGSQNATWTDMRDVMMPSWDIPDLVDWYDEWENRKGRNSMVLPCVCAARFSEPDNRPNCREKYELLVGVCRADECIFFIAIETDDGLDAGQIAGIVVGIVVAVVIVCCLLGTLIFLRRNLNRLKMLQLKDDVEDPDIDDSPTLTSSTMPPSMPLHGYLQANPVVRGPPISSVYDYESGESESESDLNSKSCAALGELRSANRAFKQQYGSNVQYKGDVMPDLMIELAPDVAINIEQIHLRLREDGTVWKVGDGGFSEVFRGWYNGEDVAVKVLRHMIGHKQARDQLEKELDILKRLDQENVVGFKGACLTPQLLMLVLEYLPNGDLFHVLCSRRSYEYQWRNRGQKIALDIAHGLAYLHSLNIVHCDLKSLNILLAADGTAKLADMGMSKFLHDTFVTKGGQLGTLAWAAPELLNDRKINEKVDVYSFGVVLWEIITGEMPERGKRRPPRVPTECDQDVVDLMDSCLLEDPEARPTSEQVYNTLNRMINPDLSLEINTTFSTDEMAYNMGAAKSLESL